MKKTKPDVCLIIMNYWEYMKAFYLKFLKDVMKKGIPIIILPANETENQLIKIINEELKSLKFIAIKPPFWESMDND